MAVMVCLSSLYYLYLLTVYVRRRHRGGVLPPVVEIRNPRLDSKLKIDMPNLDSSQIYKVFSRENLIALSVQSLRAVPDWKNVIERQLAEGDVLQLCWRQGSYLDWIWLNKDVDGRLRDWDVLCGLALKQVCLQGWVASLSFCTSHYFISDEYSCASRTTSGSAPSRIHPSKRRRATFGTPFHRRLR